MAEARGPSQLSEVHIESRTQNMLKTSTESVPGILILFCHESNTGTVIYCPS